MSRRVPVLPLRGSDLTLLEVQLPDLFRRPISQIAPVNVMDLIELAATEGRPKKLDRGLQTFVEGVGRQVSDIPKGRSWEEFLDALAELPGSRVPERFRQMLVEEAVSTERNGPRIHQILEKWSAEPPEPFPLGVHKARIQRAEMVQPRAPAPEPSAAPRERTGKRKTESSGTSRPRSSSGGTSRSTGSRTAPVVDIDRRDFVVDQCIERLGRSIEKGLAEMVLVAGVRQAAKEQYPDITPLEITGVLKQLRDASRVRYSAGRWMLVTRF
ncbi:MAG: hypothetical protein R3F59_37205 [Myxococcota bacterium]